MGCSCVSVGPRARESTPPALLAFRTPAGWPILSPRQPQPAQGPSSPVIHRRRGSELLGTWEREQSRGAGRRRASPGPHRSQPLGPHCPLGLAPDLKLPIPDQAARSPHWLVPMVTLKPPGRAHKTGHKAEGWEEEPGCRLRWGPAAPEWECAGASPVRDLTIHLVGSQAQVLFLPHAECPGRAPLCPEPQFPSL